MAETALLGVPGAEPLALAALAVTEMPVGTAGGGVVPGKAFCMASPVVADLGPRAQAVA